MNIRSYRAELVLNGKVVYGTQIIKSEFGTFLFSNNDPLTWDDIFNMVHGDYDSRKVVPYTIKECSNKCDCNDILIYEGDEVLVTSNGDKFRCKVVQTDVNDVDTWVASEVDGCQTFFLHNLDCSELEIVE
jgi:hypothetical protein